MKNGQKRRRENEQFIHTVNAVNVCMRFREFLSALVMSDFHSEDMIYL